MRGGQRHEIRDPHFRRGHAANFFEHAERLLHRPIPFGVAEDVALADAPFFRGEDVADGNVAHMHPVQTCVQIGRHFTVQEIDDHLPGRRRLHIARADRCARIDDDHRRALGRQFARGYFGSPLGELIMVAHLGFRHRRRFVRGCHDAVDFLRQANAADGAGINDARTARGDGGFDHVSRTLNIRRVHRRVITQP